MKIETKKPQEQLMENAKAQGIKLSPLSAYYKENREEIQNTYVMNYSSIELEKIEMVVTRLAKCCEQNIRHTRSIPDGFYYSFGPD